MAKIPTTKLSIIKKYAADTEGYIKIQVWPTGEKSPVPKATGYKVPLKAWEPETESVKRSHPDASLINEQIHKERDALIEAFKADLKREVSFTRDYIKAKLSPRKATGDFLQFYIEHIEYLRSKFTPAYCNHFYIEYRSVKSFGGDDLSFADITTEFLEKYEASLKIMKGGVLVPVARTTKNSKCKRLKEIIDKAIERGYMHKKAIAGYKWPEYEEPERKYLTLEETQAIAGRIYDGAFKDDPALLATACYFLIECYSGIRFSDWTRFEVETLIANRNFKVGQTRKTRQPVYLPLDDFKSLDKIVRYVTDNKILFALDLNIVNRLLKIVASSCGIKKVLTSHIGRHTFATLCAEKGYSTSWIAQALAISEQTAKTYIKHTQRGMEYEVKKYGGF